MSDTAIQWLKLPLIGCPGTECGKMLLAGGGSEVAQSFKDEFGPCEEFARWMAGDLLLCQDHAAKVAVEFGDNIEAIEKAWLEQLAGGAAA